MRYYKKDGREYIENGNSKLRVTTMDMRPSPRTLGRVLKIMVVNEVIAANPGNPIRHGSALAISFPPEHVNSINYLWYEYDPGEECQVPIRVKLMRQIIKDRK